MGQIGTVIGMEANQMTCHVLIKRREACGECHACANGTMQKDLEVDAINRCGAEVGDQVEIDLKEEVFLSAVLLLYIVPLGGMLAGGLCGYVIGDYFVEKATELVAFIFGLFGLALTYWVIHTKQKSMDQKKYQPIATAIVSEPASGCKG